MKPTTHKTQQHRKDYSLHSLIRNLKEIPPQNLSANFFAELIDEQVITHSSCVDLPADRSGGRQVKASGNQWKNMNEDIWKAIV